MSGEDRSRREREALQREYEANEAFNAYFDGDTELQVPSRAGLDDRSFRPSEVLFWFDRVAYDEELVAWRARSTQDEHAEALKLLSDADRAVVTQVVEAVGRNRLVPFVGAGVSKAMNFPLWAEALKAIAAKLNRFQRSRFDETLDKLDYLGAAQCLFDHDSVVVTNYIKTTFSRGTPAGPVLSLPRISRGCVVTTNFDLVLEDVFSRAGKQFDAYMYGGQHGNNFVSRLARGDRCLLKLHGNAESPETHVFTQKQYDGAYGTTLDYRRPLPRVLRQLFIGHSLLFIGCSLENDRTLELFGEAKRGDYEVPDHYAILELPADADSKAAKESRLLSLGIQPIWFPHRQFGFVGKLVAMLADLVEEKLPMRSLARRSS